MSVVVKPSQELQPFELHELFQLADHSCVLDGHCLGWVPRAIIRGKHDQGRILGIWNNGDCVGWLGWAVSQGLMRIHYTWIRNDARLILHGRALVDAVNDLAHDRQLPRIELWCATDLAANVFWRALGFECICWRWGRAKKSRRHYLWRRPVYACSPTDFSQTNASTRSPRRLAFAPPAQLARPSLPPTQAPPVAGAGRAR